MRESQFLSARKDLNDLSGWPTFHKRIDDPLARCCVDQITFIPVQCLYDPVPTPTLELGSVIFEPLRDFRQESLERRGVVIPLDGKGQQAAMERRDAGALKLKEMVDFVDWTKASP